jgi:hypothetical protein
LLKYLTKYSYIMGFQDVEDRTFSHRNVGQKDGKGKGLK